MSWVWLIVATVSVWFVLFVAAVRLVEWLGPRGLRWARRMVEQSSAV